MSALRIRKFNPTTIKESRILFILGKRHTGKSVLLKDLLYHMPRPDYVLAMWHSCAIAQASKPAWGWPGACIFARALTC